MRRLWSFLRLKRNREILGWLGGGAVVVIGGLWTAYTFLAHQPAPPPDQKIDCTITENQGQAACRDIVNSGPVTFGPRPAPSP